MVIPVQIIAIRLRTMKLKKDSSILLANRKGNMDAMTVTDKIFIYTFFKYTRTGKPIIPCSINRRAVRQHWDMMIATTITTSGNIPIRNKM